MKPIIGFEGYSVTKEGKVWAHPKKGKGGHQGKFLKMWKIGHGYEVVALYVSTGNSVKHLVHRLVAKTYIPNPQGLPEVNHKNGIITDNRPQNLEWVTSKGNKIHAWENGLYSHKGSKHYLAKLNSEKVREMRNEYKGKRGQIASFARRYNVSEGTIRDVLRGNTWKEA